jgi:hypothetical protein
MEESRQFVAYQETLRAKNVNACNALLSRLARFHGDAFVRVAPVVVIEAPEPPPPPPLLRVEIAPELPAKPAEPVEEDDGPRRPTVTEIRKCVAKHFNVSMNDLMSPRRFHKVVIPRQIGFYLARKLTRQSLPDIGRRFGGKDHTTVLHGSRVIERKIAEDPIFAQTVAQLEAQFS